MARSLAFAALCLTAWALPAQGQAPDPGERARRDLDSLFQPGATVNRTPHDDYGQTAAHARLRTRIYATSFAGVCGRDEVIIAYSPSDAPYRVKAESWFRVLRDPPTTYRGPPVAGECAGLDGAGTQGWFIAPDAYQAAEGHRALATARELLNTRGSNIAGCRESRLQLCRTILTSAMETVTRIDPCAAAPQRSCYRVLLNDGSALTIRLLRRRTSGERIEAIEIEPPGITITAWA